MRSSSSPGRTGGARSPARDFFVDYSRPRWRRTSCSSRCGCRSSRRLGRALREVPPGGPGVVDGGGRRGGPPRERAIAEARVALTDMGPTPVRASGGRGGARRRRRDDGGDRRRRRSRRGGHHPSSDLNAQADYREHLAKVLTRGRCRPPPGCSFYVPLAPSRPARRSRRTGRAVRQEVRRAAGEHVHRSGPIDEAWRVLLDIERIAPCMPGAALDTVDGDDFTGR